MEGSGVEFEANDGKDEDGEWDEEANLEENICDNILHTLYDLTHII